MADTTTADKTEAGTAVEGTTAAATTVDTTVVGTACEGQTEREKRQGKRYLQLMSVLCMGWLFYGLDSAAVNVVETNQNFLDKFQINSSRLGLYGLFPSLGALISVLGIGGAINRYFGRKRGFQIATFLVVLGVCLYTFPSQWGAILTGRILMGIGGDTNGLVLGYYITEISPKNTRGRFLILVQQFSSSFFAIVAYWIIYGISYLPQDKAYSWKVANALQFIPGVIFFFLTFTLPESPRWLARKYPTDDEPMLRSLASIRALPIDDPAVVDEAKEIRDYDNWSVEHGSVTLWNIFTSKRYFKRVFHAFIPFLAMQFSGIGFLTIYAAVIYEKLGLTTQHAALLLNACTQILYAIAALGSSYVVENLGRRKCIVYSQFLNTLGVAIITGLSIGYENKSGQNVADGFVVAFIILITFNYWLLATGPTTVYANEILPTQAREIGVGMANVIPIAIGVALGQEWPTASDKLGAKSYIILLCTSAVGSALVWYFVVEPKGVSIEHVDVLFGETDHVEDFRHEMEEKVHVTTKE